MLSRYYDSMAQHPTFASITTAMFKVKDVPQTPKSASLKRRRGLSIEKHTRFAELPPLYSDSEPDDGGDGAAGRVGGPGAGAAGGSRPSQ